MTEAEDIRRRVVVQLEQYVEHPPQNVSMAMVNRYHRLLDQLDGIGLDTSDFRIDPATDMGYNALAVYYAGQGVGSVGEKEMEPEDFLRFVGALLRYFEIREKPVIFSSPSKE